MQKNSVYFHKKKAAGISAEPDVFLELRQKIVIEELKMRKPSGLGLREIAQKLNLDISTVSRALNRNCQVSKETTELVLRTANEMGYHKQQNRKCIVVVLPASRMELGWYTLNLLNALQKGMMSRNYFWEYISSDRIDIIQERSVWGIISIDFLGCIAGEVGRKYNIPLVCINDASNHEYRSYSVNSDEASAIALAFGCLYDFGHRNIAYISTSGNSVTAKRRETAFLNMISRRELAEKCIFMNDSVESYHGMIHELAAKGITGIIADGEMPSLSIFNSLNYCKLAIPRKMSLITWELPHVSGMIHPAITTVEQNFAELAEKAIIMLESLIRKDSMTSDVIVPYRLNLRDSVSVPRK